MPMKLDTSESGYELRVGCYSNAGCKPKNEDTVGFRCPEGAVASTKGICCLIADGLSGSEAGKEASEATVKGFISDYYSTPESWTVQHSVQKVVSTLNRWLYAQGTASSAAHTGYVTTFSAVVLKSSLAHIFHIGDSRIYRLRADVLEQLTTDHCVWTDGEKSFLTRALGADVDLKIDYRKVSVETGDVLLLTTDGVHEFLSEDALLEILLAAAQDPEAGSRALAEAALANGSTDNVSAQIVHIDGLPDDDEDAFYSKLTALPFPPELEAGMSLDGYRIVREIRASSRSQIYLVADRDSGAQMVMKTPSVNFEDDAVYIDQFLHEEWVGKRLNNAHVMKVYDPARKRTCLYYLSEHIEGETLAHWIHDNPQAALVDVRAIIDQVASGLRAFHRMDMLHQDIKPDNVMIDRFGTVKIVDFGSTRIGGLAEINSPISHDYGLGTRDYSAPEVIRGEKPTNRSDIFSLGVLAYEMLTGELPYGSQVNERNLKRRNYTPARHYKDDIPSWVDGALRKATHKSAERRYQRLSEFVFDLSHPNPEFTQAQGEPLMTRNPLLFWKGLALLLALANVILLLTR